jgi:hypothetical protein
MPSKTKRSKRVSAWFEETPIGIVVKHRPSFPEYTDSVQRKARIYKSMPWVIGDLLCAGEAYFNEEAAQAWDFEAYANQTLANYKSTADRIPLQRRRADLPFSTHEVVAALPALEQRKWLKLCHLNGWTREQLRDAIAESKGEPTTAERREAKDKRPKTFGEIIDTVVELLKEARDKCGPSGRHWFHFLDMALEAIQKGQEQDRKASVTASVTGARPSAPAGAPIHTSASS